MVETGCESQESVVEKTFVRVSVTPPFLRIWDLITLDFTESGVITLSIEEGTKQVTPNSSEIKEIELGWISLVLFSESLNLANSVVLNDRKYLGFR